MIPRLHLVTDDAVLQDARFAARAIDLCATLRQEVAIHLRGRVFSGRKLFELAEQLRPHAERAGSLLLINDRVDVALSAHVPAVHLGARSLPVERVRALAAIREIGYSAHSSAEAVLAAQQGANFILAGSIYATLSHPGATPAGVQLLEACVRLCPIPVLAIGGVTRERVAEVRAAGAHGVAVIRAVWHASDPVQAATQFAKLLSA